MTKVQLRYKGACSVERGIGLGLQSWTKSHRGRIANLSAWLSVLGEGVTYLELERQDVW
jgi:hypothetical protein